MPKSKIYTKTGDDGFSTLFDGERKLKHDTTFDALGSVDELNAHLGLVQALLEAKQVDNDWLTKIQQDLMDVGSAVATPLHGKSKNKRVRFNGDYVQRVEALIDALDGLLPKLTQFILPGGGNELSANLHIARAVCRRCERDISELVVLQQVELDVLKYINRLSDLLFVVARKYSTNEIKYKK